MPWGRGSTSGAANLGWLSALVCSCVTACLTDYEVAPGGSGGGPPTSSASASTSTSTSGAPSAASSNASSNATSTGSGGTIDCVGTDALIGWWVADDLVADHGNDAVIETWSPHDGIGAPLSRAADAAPTLAHSSFNEHAVVRFPAGSVASYFEGDLDPGSTSAARDQVTIVVVARYLAESPSWLVQWGEPSRPELGSCLAEDDSVSLGRSATGIDFLAQHRADGGDCPLVEVTPAAGELDVGKAVLVGLRTRTGGEALGEGDPRMYLRRNGESLFTGGRLDRIGRLELESPTFRIGARRDGTDAFNGEIAEVLVYRRALEAGELKDLETCLGERYGIAIDPDFESCEDGSEVGEVGRDCGGSQCDALCTLGERCERGADCESGICDTGSASGRCIADPRDNRLEMLEEVFLPPNVIPFAAYFESSGQAGIRVLANASGPDDTTVTVVYGLDDDGWNPRDASLLPSPRLQPAVYQVGSTTWLYGGDSKGGLLADLWQWDGTRWIAHTVANGPIVRAAGLGMLASELIVFGGRNDDDAQRGTHSVGTLPEVGGAWVARADLPTALEGIPGGLALPHQGVLAVGGTSTLMRYAGSTWEDDGALASAATDRVAHAVVRDETRGRLVLIGGASGPITDPAPGPGNVLEWYPFPQTRDEAQPWVEVVPSGGPDRPFTVAAFDPIRNRIVALEPDLGGRTFVYYPLGSPCTADDRCATDHCVDGVCCEGACAEGERCDSEDAPGTCVDD